MLMIIIVLLLTNVLAWITVYFARRDARYAFEAADEAWELHRRESDAKREIERRLDDHLHQRSTYALRKQNEAMMQAIADVAALTPPAPVILGTQGLRNG